MAHREMKIIYIGGPFRGPHAWAIRQNIHRAEEAAMQVAELGGVPLTPHSIGANFHGTISDQFWIDATLALLQRADALYVADGPATRSVGTQGEIADAIARHLPVFYDLAELAAWLRSGYVIRAHVGHQGWVGKVDMPGHALDRFAVHADSKMNAIDGVLRSIGG